MAMSQMNSSLSGKLSHYWKFEVENSEITPGIIVYDEVGDTDFFLHLSSRHHTGSASVDRDEMFQTPFAAVSGVQDQNQVIGAQDKPINEFAYARAFLGCFNDGTDGFGSNILSAEDRLRIPDLGSGSYTIAGWFNISGTYCHLMGQLADQDPTNNSYTYLQTTSSLREYLHIGTMNNNGVLLCRTLGNPVLGSTATSEETAVSGNFNEGQWNHFAFVNDATNSSGFLYINGSLVDSSGASGYSQYFSPRHDELHRNYTLTVTNNFQLTPYQDKGSVCELGIFSGALLASEVSDLYNSGSGVTINKKLTKRPVASSVFDKAVHNYKFSENFNTAINLKDSAGGVTLPINTGQSTSGKYDVSNFYARQTSGVPHTSAISGKSISSHGDTSENVIGLGGRIYNATTQQYDLAINSGSFSFSLWFKMNRFPNASEISEEIGNFSYGPTRYLVNLSKLNSSLSPFRIAYYRDFTMAWPLEYSGIFPITYGSGVPKFTFLYNGWQSSYTAGTSNENCNNFRSDIDLSGAWHNLVGSVNSEQSEMVLFLDGQVYGTAGTNGAAYFHNEWNYELDQDFESPTWFQYVPSTEDYALVFGDQPVGNAPSEVGGIEISRSGTSNAIFNEQISYADFTMFNGPLELVEAQYIWNNGSGNFFQPTTISGSISADIGSYIKTALITSGLKYANIGNFSNQLALPSGQIQQEVGIFQAIAWVGSGQIGAFKDAIETAATRTSDVLLDLNISTSGGFFDDQTIPLTANIGETETPSSEFYQSLTVQKTDSSQIGAKVRVGKNISIPSGNILSVLVNGSGISESSGFLYSQASGLTVTVSGSYSGSKQIHNASIDFCEGANSYSGGLSVVNNNFSASHTYSYPGIYSITTRVQDIDGSVNMERFRLNLASGLAGVNLGGISASGSPTSGLINSENYLTVSFSASGASGLSPSTPSDSNLHWRFGNNSTSQKQSPRTNYAQPGNYVPVVIYKNTTASGIVYLTDSIKVGIND